jgi:hypothetical protein
MLSKGRIPRPSLSRNLCLALAPSSRAAGRFPAARKAPAQDRQATSPCRPACRRHPSRAHCAPRHHRSSPRRAFHPRPCLEATPVCRRSESRRRSRAQIRCSPARSGRHLRRSIRHRKAPCAALRSTENCGRHRSRRRPTLYGQPRRQRTSHQKTSARSWVQISAKYPRRPRPCSTSISRQNRATHLLHFWAHLSLFLQMEVKHQPLLLQYSRKTALPCLAMSRRLGRPSPASQPLRWHPRPRCHRRWTTRPGSSARRSCRAPRAARALLPRPVAVPPVAPSAETPSSALRSWAPA